MFTFIGFVKKDNVLFHTEGKPVAARSKSLSVSLFNNSVKTTMSITKIMCGAVTFSFGKYLLKNFRIFMDENSFWLRNDVLKLRLI
jgi:hypothetical protein